MYEWGLDVSRGYQNRCKLKATSISQRMYTFDRVMISLKQKYPSITFGTSGVRALVTDLSVNAVMDYVQAFAKHISLQEQYDIPLVLGIDLRPSSPVIAQAVIYACERLGIAVDFVGAVPTPALAFYAMQRGYPAIMITGSHIPFDRNGLKFYLASGEISKQDEQAMLASPVAQDLVATNTATPDLPSANPAALNAYEQRYLAFFASDALKGQRIGVYEHSAVCRDSLKRILTLLGASVIGLGRSNAFIPIDTEAISDADRQLAKHWCKEHALAALVSTDGDSDRPLVFDDQGQWIAGDILGLLCAQQLGIQRLVTPVSCNSLLEQATGIQQVLRTKIGSPYVIDGIQTLLQQRADAVAGFEANGGFILASAVPSLATLPTRDAFLPILNVLSLIGARQQPLSVSLATLIQRKTDSQRIQGVPTSRSNALLEYLKTHPEILAKWLNKSVDALTIDTTDGLRFMFNDQDIVHLRPSGNAPELRCYTESSNEDTAKSLCKRTIMHLTSELQA